MNTTTAATTEILNCADLAIPRESLHLVTRGWKTSAAAAKAAEELEAGDYDGWKYRVAVDPMGRFRVAIFDEAGFAVGYYG